MSFDIVMTIIAISSVAMVYFSTKSMMKAWKENKELRAELEKQKRNSAYLATHAAKMARIERSNRELKQEVKNAKSDDKIVDIIHTVLDRNNNLVQDNGKR